MGSKFKVKSGKISENKDKTVKSSLSARQKMGFLFLWSGTAVGIYIALSKYFAMTPVVVTECLLFFGLLAYFILGIKMRGEAKGGEGSKRLTALLDAQKLILIFIIPLIFIIIYDFVITTVRVM